MKFTSTLFALAATLSLTSAAPATSSSLKTRDYGYGSVEVTFLGATNNDDQSYSIYVDISPSADSSKTYTSSYDPYKLSISYVEYDHKKAICYFTGVDSANYAPPVEAVIDDYKGQLGPPQTITEVICVKAY